MATWVEIDVAERGVYAFHEVGRREAAIPIVLVALPPIGSLGRATTGIRCKHRQKTKQTSDRSATPLQTSNGRRRQAGLRRRLSQ